MKIGLMADTHDRVETVEAAIDVFNHHGVSDVLHAGDLVSPFMAPRFSRLKARLHYVWGNNEGDREYIRVKFGEIGVVPIGEFAALELGGRKIALLHGTHEAIVDSLVSSSIYDMVVRGHTHEVGIIEGRTLVVNPGEVCGYLSGRYTVVLTELEVMQSEIVDL